jgi:hypothetical protein
MEANREQGSLSEHALEARSKFDLRYGEPVPKMQGTIHIGVRKGAQPFALIRCARQRCVNFENFLCGPT